MTLQVILLFSLLVSASSVSVPVSDQPVTPTDYVFSYGVNDDKSGSSFGHQETTDGQTTAGEYRVALPDGRLQVVKYTADENGYNAVVTYEGSAVHPDQDPAVHAAPVPGTVTTAHPPVVPTHPPVVLPVPSHPPQGFPTPTHPPVPPHPAAFPPSFPVPSNGLPRFPGAQPLHFNRPEPVRPRPKLVSVGVNPAGTRLPQVPPGALHAAHVRPPRPTRPVVAGHPTPADLSLFVPAEDLHKTNIPSALSNAVHLDFSGPVNARTHSIGPISRHHGAPTPLITSPAPQHIPLTHHHPGHATHPVPTLPHPGPLTHGIAHTHGIPPPPHGKQISHVTSRPHEDHVTHVAPTPFPLSTGPFLQSPGPLHAKSTPIHHGLGPLAPTPVPHPVNRPIHHLPGPGLHDPTPLPHHPGPIAHNLTPIPHLNQITHSTPIIPHSTPIPHHAVPVTHHSTQSIHHSTPIPHHGVPVAHHSLPRVLHSTPIPHHGVPVEHHSLPRVLHSSPIPHLNTPVTHSARTLHHSSPIPPHPIPVTHRTSPVTHHSEHIPLHSSPIIKHSTTGAAHHNLVPTRPSSLARGRGFSRGKSFRGILGGGEIPPFLPGAPTLDRGQYLRHKGVERSGRSPQHSSESLEE